MDIRPKYHITPIKGWINDPNGVIKFKGKYHVFYQYHPYSLEWGPMHWGHVVSDDLLHWEHLPIALTPGDEFDKDGCFSGSSIIYNNRLYIIYTGFIFNEDPSKIIQHQCLAYSDDGINFTKVGLVIGEDNLPDEYSINDFRDPTVYQEGDDFILFVGAKKKSGKGNILKYQSKDLIHWTFISSILEEKDEGNMIECVDYIKDLNLIIGSEQFAHKPNIHSVLYWLGEFKKDKYVINKKSIVDYGFDFYAPQVFFKDNIMIAWMNMWERNNPSEKYNFAGSLTIPRKLEIRDDELYQTPVLPKGTVEKYDIKKEYKDHIKIGFQKIEFDDLESFSLKLRKGIKNQTVFKFENNEWVFDRSHSGEPLIGSEKDNDSLKGIRRMPYKNQKHHEMYIVLDEFSIEIFVDGKSLTSLIYPDLEDDLLELNIKADNVSLYKYFDK